MAIGRISGQMLKANLLRSGTDLAFETNLLALDVSNSRVGVGTASPATTLHVSATDALRIPSGTTAQRPGSPANGDVRYNTTTSQIEGYSNGQFRSMVGSGIDNVVEDTTPQLGGDLDVNGNAIVSTSDGNIAITPNGTGEVDISKVDIDSGAIDGTTIGANSAAAGTFTTLTATTGVNLDDGGDGAIDGCVIGANTAAAGTFTNLTANGTIDIDSTGNMDGIVIGANTAAAGTFTTLTTTGATTIGGNLTVNGTTTTVDSATLTVEDPLIQLAKNNSGGAANAFDQGLFFNRGSLDNVSFLWDESADQFAFAVTASEDGTTAGNVTIDSYANIKLGVATATDVETASISAADGTASATIANSTGVMTIASSVLTTADINGGTIDGTIIGGSSAAAVTTSSLVATTADINAGTIDNTTIGGTTRAAASVTTLDANSTITISADSTALRIGAGNDLQLSHDGTNSSIANSTGDLQITGVAGSEVVFNEASADIDFRVESNGNTAGLFVDAGNDRVGVMTASPSYALDVSGSTDALKLPSGNTAQRPSATAGIIRYNTQTSKYEACNDGSTYVELAIAGDTPSISKVSATGDGSTTVFGSFFGSAPETVNNVLVFIDNVMQEPTENYTVSGTTITFTSAPHSGARIFALTGFDNTALASGGIARTQTSSVSFESTATTIMSFNASSYRAAELLITITDSANTEYGVMKAHVIHNGSVAFGNIYGAVNTGSSDLATITFDHDGSNTVNVKATSTGGAQTALVQYSLQAV